MAPNHPRLSSTLINNKSALPYIMIPPTLPLDPRLSYCAITPISLNFPWQKFILDSCRLQVAPNHSNVQLRASLQELPEIISHLRNYPAVLWCSSLLWPYSAISDGYDTNIIERLSRVSSPFFLMCYYYIYLIIDSYWLIACVYA